MTAAGRATRHFPRAVLAAIDDSRILGIRAGETHRFTGVWPVVVDARVFIRSWECRPTGWCHAFRNQPNGAIQVGDRQLAVRARPVRGKRLLDAVEQAYAEKYRTPASRKYVIGFRRPRRRGTTTELLPRLRVRAR